MSYYGARGVDLDALDLRRPSMEHLRLSAMIAHVRERIDGTGEGRPGGADRERAVLFGSSLGGLTACRVAERDARVCALVLLAPAFGLAARWRERLGPAQWERWRTSGSIEVDDHATGGKARVDYGFVDEIERIDAADGGWPDVRVPVLIVHGRSDDAVPVERSRAFAAGRRHVRLVEVDDGHELTASLDRIATEADAFLAGFLGSVA